MFGNLWYKHGQKQTLLRAKRSLICQILKKNQINQNIL